MLHQIGSGVLGPVFRTFDPQSDSLVAVKVFRLDLLPEDVARLADGLRRLTLAPGFVAAGLENTSAYLATEYLAGETLDVALRHLAPAAPEVAVPILERAAALIDAAWGASSDASGKEGGPHLGHGALHPRDIFVMPGTNDVAITGFGVAPALEAIGAKPPIRRPYTAPERAAGERWDIRADIYSLAAIAHELLTGRRPAGPSEQDGTLPASIAPETRSHIRRVLSKALSESPAHRFATATEFVAALGDLSTLPEPVVVSASAQPTPAPDELPFASAEPAPVARKSKRAKPADPEPLTLLPVVDPADTRKVAEFDLSHVIRQDDEVARLLPVQPEPPTEPLLRAGRSAGAEAPDYTPQLIRPLTASDFTMPPPTPWLPMIAVAIACLILGAAIDHQWMLSKYGSRTQTAGGATGTPDSAPSTPAPSTPASPDTKDPAKSDTEVAVSEPTPAASPANAKSANKAAPLPGRIVIRSVPAGAMVTIDGKSAGRTPFTAANLSLAPHTVVIARPGYASQTRRVSLTRRAPASTLAVTLRADRRAAGAANTPAASASSATSGSVAIDSRPRGARITIDGRAVGQSPASVPGLTPGTHSLRLELDGYKPLVTTVTVKAGETARVAVTLEIR